MEHSEGPQHDVEVSEQADEWAEKSIIGDSYIRETRDNLINNFDQGISPLGGDEKFSIAFKQALDELIDTSARNLVNVNNLSPEKRGQIMRIITKRMDQFTAQVASEVGTVREAEDVIKAKKQLHRLFEYREREFAQPGVEYARETDNNAKFEFTSQQTGGAVQSLTLTYTESTPGSTPITMTVESKSTFFGPHKDEGEKNPATPDLTTRIRQNRDAYRVPRVTYEVSDPYAFQQFILNEMTEQGYNAAQISPEQAYNLVIEISKKHLTNFASNEEALATGGLDADKEPIDLLLMTKDKSLPICCRHFTAAVTTLFEQTQILAIREGNHSLENMVAFENTLPSMAHATVAFAQGERVTVSDPFWYADNCLQTTGGTITTDATFTGKHSNVSSLYATLSRTPVGHPEQRIFDMGSMERFVIVFGDYNFSNTCDNQLQRHLMRQTEVINNEKLQNFDAISRTYSGLEKMATTYIKRADIQPHKMHAEAALGQSYKLVNKILPRKISDKNNTAEHQQFYESFLEGLETSIIPSLENMLFA